MKIVSGKVPVNLDEIPGDAEEFSGVLEVLGGEGACGVGGQIQLAGTDALGGLVVLVDPRLEPCELGHRFLGGLSSSGSSCC